MSGDVLAPSLRAACERWASRPAVTAHGRTLTYAQLWERVLRLAWAYRSLGIGRGDRVVCQLPTGPEYLIAANAAWACGAIHVGAHRDLTGAEIAGIVGRTQATALIVQPPAGSDDPLAHLQTVRSAHPATVAIVHGAASDGATHGLADLLAAPAPHPHPPDPCGPDDLALLLLTSGTTGEPKAVEETLGALWAKMAFFADAVGPGPEDVHLMYLPVSHAFGLKLSLMALASGGRLVMLDRFSPEEALRLVDAEQVTILPGSPTHLTLLLAHLDPARHRVDTLRWAVSAAAPLPAAVVDELYDRLGVDVLFVYGSSEGFLTSTTDREEIRRGSVGKHVFAGPDGTEPGGAVAVVDPAGSKTLPSGEVGEIVYRTVRPVRYWGQAPVAADGWYRTGDLGWMEPDGCLHVTGRLKEVINRGGLKVPAGEVEAGLGGHPGVADCAVIPAPDPVLGEAICACVVPDGSGPPSLAEVRAHLAAQLARHKLPDELCVLDAIPRSSVGKIDRKALVTLAVEGNLPRERWRPR